MNLKERFDLLVATHGIKHWSFAARKDFEFMSAVEKATEHLPSDITFAERVYCAVHDFNPLCSEGNRKKLVSIIKGWSFCGPAGRCACARQVISEKSRDNIDHEARLAKTRATLLERYGTENPGTLPQTKEAHREFYADPLRTAEAVKRQISSAKSNDSYRSRSQKSAEAKVLRTKTRKEKQNQWQHCDTPSGMICCMVCNRPQKMISEAHCRTHDMTVSQYIERFPDAPIASEAVSTARKRTLRSASNIARLKELTEQSHTPEAREILFSQERLLEMVKALSTPTIAKKIGVDPETVRRYALRYGHVFDTSTSSFEREIAQFLRLHDIDFNERTRKVIAPKELDFYLPDYNLAIEFNGLYWHSDAVVGHAYHRDKWERCRSAGIRLLMINEDEWIARQDVLKKKILNLCGKSEKGCGARKLRVETISNNGGLDFVDRHHIQGRPATCSIAYGAFWNDDLVAVVTLSRQRGTGHLDLSRFCTDGRIFPGSFSKILSAIRKSIDEPIVTFADLRYSDGGLYERCGFVNEGEIRPDYRYVKGRTTYHKSLFTKARIAKKFGLDMSGKTEREAMAELGYLRIYDCGKIRFRI
jgi:very-short-patch-repair endonuclease